MRQNGYSLIEIVVVLTIAGILMTIASIAFNKWTIKYNIESEVKQIYSDLMEARIRAMGSNRFRFVTFGAANYDVYDDTDYDGPPLQPSSDAHVLQQGRLQNQMSLLPAGTTQISFDQHGLASANATISFTNSVGAAYDCISITQTRVGMGIMDGAANCIQK